LADHYRRYKDPATGKVDNILKAHSLSPEGLKAHLAVYLYAMGGTKDESIAALAWCMNANNWATMRG